MLEAVMFGHKGFQPVINAIIDLAEKAAKEPWDFSTARYQQIQKVRLPNWLKRICARLLQHRQSKSAST